MSVIFAVGVPVVMLEWPLLCATVAGVASTLGFSILISKTVSEMQDEEQRHGRVRRR